MPITPAEDFTLEVRTVLSTTGSVSSVDVSGGSTGLVFTGGPVTTTGTITMSSGQLVVANGGTGAATLTGLLRGNGTAAITGAATVALGSEVSGILGVANGGTGLSGGTATGIPYYSGVATIASSAALTTNRLIAGGASGPQSIGSLGTTTTVLHGNAGGLPTFGAVVLTTDVSGILPVANGGSGVSTTFTQGSVVFAGASGLYSQDNANFFWDDTNNKLGIGTASPLAPVHVSSARTGLTASGAPLNIDDTTALAINTGGTLVFRGKYTSGGSLTEFGAISSHKANATDTNYSANMALYTRLTGTGAFSSMANGGPSGSGPSLVLMADGKNGFNTNAPNFPLSVNGTIEIMSGSGGVLKFADGTTQSSAAAAGGTLGGSGVLGQSAFFTGAASLGGDNAFWWDNTNKRLGIGTNAPAILVDIRKATSASAFADAGEQLITTTSAASNVTHQASPYFAQFASIWTGAATSKGMFQQTQGISGTTSAYGLVIASSDSSNILVLRGDTGYLGVGWSTPAAKLDIKDDASTCLRLSGSTSGYVGLRPAATAGSTTYTLPSADGSANYVLKTNGAGTLSWTANGTPIGVYDVTTYGAVADGKVVQDGSMDNNVTFNLTCASAPFVVGDVGKSISVSGAGAAGTLAYGTITGFTSSSIVAVSFKNTSGGAISGKTVSWGTDNTAAFSNALAAANTTPAFGSVVVPPGTYRISTHFTIPVGVRLSGNGVGPKWAAYGSVLHQVEGYGSAAGTACISLGFNSTLEGIGIYSPHQVTSGTPVAYPFTIKGSAYSTIQNIFLYNAYQGVDVASETNNPYNGAFTIRGLYGEPLALGIDVNKSYDVAEISNVHFWPFWSLNESTMATWKMNNAIGIRFGRSDYQLMSNVYIGNMGIGLQLNHNSAVSDGGTSGTWTNIQLDSCRICIDAYETGFNGVLISNMFCSGVNIGGGTNYGIKTNYDATLYTIITVNNAHFWSNLQYGIYIDNPNGLHSFTQCQFHQCTNTHAYINRGSTSLVGNWFLPVGTTNGLNVTVSCTQNVMFTNNQMFTTSITISNATTLSANNQ